jgi:hypothetical protein
MTDFAANRLNQDLASQLLLVFHNLPLVNQRSPVVPEIDLVPWAV